MRKKLFTFFLTLVASVSVINASNKQVDGIWYDFDSSTETASVTYKGTSYYQYDGEYSGSVIIPETVTYQGTTYSVTSIGDNAFHECSLLSSITIPNSVTSIGKWAFRKCSSLTSITIPNSLTSIGDSPFFGCSGLTSVVWNIKNFADFSSYSKSPFYDIHSQITSFTFGECVQHIPAYLCNNMSKLNSVTIPNSVTSIGSSAFIACYGLDSITIGESVTSIGDEAFADCLYLTSINSLSEVPPVVSSTAFRNVLRSIPVYVPCGKVATYKATSVWKSFSNIQEPLAEYSISVYSNNETMGYTNIDKNSICGTQISATPNYGYHFVKWSDGNTDNPRILTLTQNTILTAEFAQTYSGQCGDNLYWSFNNNTLTITGFGYMWDECPWGLFAAETKTIVFPDGITSIGDNAFDGFINLTSITIPNSITSIGTSAFSGCSGLASIVWNAKECNDFSSSAKAPFYDIYAQITSFTFGESVQHIPAYLCDNMSNLTSVTIGNNVTSIGYRAFSSCSGLTSITIPNSVTSIGGSAFKECYSLTSITIGESVASIGSSAFEGCSGLTSIVWDANKCNDFSSASKPPFYDIRSQITSFTFGESVQHIPAYLCYEMSNLTSITIGESVTSIGEYAFYKCSGLTSINSLTEVPPFLDGTVFDNTSIPVYVPCGSVSAYESAESWNTFTNIQELLAEYSISVYSNNETMGYANIDKNSICGAQISATPNYGYHFVKWSDGNTDNPRTLTLTQNTTFTAEFAQTYSGQCGDNLYWSFNNSTLTITGFGDMWDERPWGLFVAETKTILFPNGITSIGYEAFLECSSLTSVTIPNSVTKIGEGAFESCSSLTSITIPNSVTNIKSGAFADCERLEKVSLGYGMEYIGGEAFAGCNSLRDIYCYATNPPEIKESSFANYNAKLYVPCDSKEDYEFNPVWGDFKYIECINVESAVDDIPTATTNEQKFLIDGQLYILKDGKTYNAMGQEIR